MENWLHQMTMVVRDIIHSFKVFFLISQCIIITSTIIITTAYYYCITYQI